MEPEIYAALVFNDATITDDICAMLHKLGASKCWLKGDKIERTTIVHEYNGCKFTAPVEKDNHLGNVASKFIRDLIEGHNELVGAITTWNLSPMLSLTAYVTDVMPSIHFQSSVLTFLAENNITLDVDIILISEE
ncbi:MAG TPA: hypothetical protein VHV83_21735 [Armatimonadota bacterium]|nr:hypothetical protein [Armatimonadota bacterium]